MGQAKQNDKHSENHKRSLRVVGGSEPAGDAETSVPAVAGHQGHDPLTANVVRLRGKVSTAPEQRTLPSGSSLVTMRVSVPRGKTPMTEGSRQLTDWVDCSVWAAQAQESILAWRSGDIVEVHGALRRRFYRGPTGTMTRLEVEVLSGRLLETDPSRRDG